MRLRLPTELSGLDKVACVVATLAVIGTVVEIGWPHPMEVQQDDTPTVEAEPAPTTQESDPARPDPRAIADRPLFTVDRKPYQIPVDDPLGPRNDERPDSHREPEVSFELRAVIRTSSATIALLQVSGQNAPTRLRPGEQIAGWTLREIDNESVRLERDGREIRVVLHSKNNDSRDG